MSTPSSAAKAAAILCFTSAIDDRKHAVAVYDEIEAASDNEDLMVSILNDRDILIWEAVEDMAVGEWWSQVVMLAASIDGCREELSDGPF